MGSRKFKNRSMVESEEMNKPAISKLVYRPGLLDTITLI